jgi:hypothetical protein
MTEIVDEQRVEEMLAGQLQAASPAVGPVVDRGLVGQLVEQARAGGVALTGQGGLLQQLTKVVLESALDGEITDHLGYDRHDPVGHHSGNSRNGTRVKTVLTEIGPVQIEVPRDRDGSFEPRLVRKRQRRLSGVDEMVISLAAKGLTTGEISAHLAEVYGAQVSRATIGVKALRRLDIGHVKIGHDAFGAHAVLLTAVGAHMIVRAAECPPAGRRYFAYAIGPSSCTILPVF